MNDDYAHLLLGAVLDYQRLGKALKAVIRARGVTLADVQHQTRVARPSVSRATAGVKIGTGPLLLLCIWADLNPFELLRPPSAVRDSTAKVFHGKQVLKLSENKQLSLTDARPSACPARARPDRTTAGQPCGDTAEGAAHG